MIELGFGSSHVEFPFNLKLFWKIVVAMANINEEAYMLHFLLKWAGHNISILDNYFEMIAPTDESVRELLFHCIFNKYYGIKTRIEHDKTALNNCNITISQSILANVNLLKSITNVCINLNNVVVKM